VQLAAISALCRGKLTLILYKDRKRDVSNRWEPGKIPAVNTIFLGEKQCTVLKVLIAELLRASGALYLKKFGNPSLSKLLVVT